MEAITRTIGLSTGRSGWSEVKRRYSVKGLRPPKDHLADKPWFNFIVVICILADAVIVGFEVDYAVGESVQERLAYWLMDFIFTFVFLTEMVVRMHQQGWEYFRDAWNVFDYFCVSMGVSGLVQPSIDGTSGSSENQRDVANLRVVKALKGVRVLRLLRIVRFITGLQFVKGLWLLVASLMASFKTLLWVCVLIVLSMYIFSVVLVSTIGDDANLFEHWKDADVYVSSVSNAMLTVLQVSTLDAWASEIGRPILQAVPGAIAVVFCIIIVVTFGVFNVMLAVMVEHIRNTMETNKKKTAKRLEDCESNLLEGMAKDFLENDVDNSGELDYTEFSKLIRTEDFNYKLRLIGVQSAEADELFKLMDSDDSGSLSPEEFIIGLRKIRGPAMSQDLLHVICFAQKECGRARMFVERIQRLSERADILQKRLNTMGTGITAEFAHQKQGADQYEKVKQRAAVREETLRVMEVQQTTDFPSVAERGFDNAFDSEHWL